MTKPSIMQQIDERADHFAAGSDSNYASAHKAGFYAGAQAYASLLAELQDNQFRELVGISLGRASVAWSELPNGVFDSNACVELVDKIMAMHQDLRAKDLLEIERLSKEIDGASIILKCYEDDLNAERQRVKRLREALEKILNHFIPFDRAPSMATQNQYLKDIARQALSSEVQR